MMMMLMMIMMQISYGTVYTRLLTMKQHVIVSVLVVSVSAESVEASVSGKALSMLVRVVEAEDDVQDDASSVGLPLFESTRLKASAYDSRQDDNSEQGAVKDAAVHLLSGKRVSSVTADGYYHDICPSAVALLLRTQPSVLDQYNPAHVDGDGNCLFRAVSMALYGTQEYHQNLRLLIR